MTILVLVHFVMKRPPRTQRAVAHGVEHALSQRSYAAAHSSSNSTDVSCTRTLLLLMERLGVARDSIALENPTPSLGEAEGAGLVEMATHRADHSTAIEAARARTVLACGLANATFSKHRVYLLAANLRAQRLPRIVPAGIFPGATTPVRVVFNSGGIQTGVRDAVPPGVAGRPARHVLPGRVRRSTLSLERVHRCWPRRAPWRRRHHAWSLGQRRWRLFAEVAVFAQASLLALALRLPCRAPWASEIVLGSSGAVTVVVVPTNAPRLVGYDRGQGARLGGGLHQPSCILKPGPERRKGGNPDWPVLLADVGSHHVAV